MFNRYSPLPGYWRNVQPGTIYYTIDTRKVSFSSKQVRLGVRQDPRGKHLQAIETGDVFPTGHQGLVPSELVGYNRKTKVLGQGGDRRYHGYFAEDGTLHFPGTVTTH